ncbi:MAG: thermonuclease family protein [Bacteroidota bacterium]
MLFRYKAKVVKVVDGDTFDVDLDLGFYIILRKQRIRLKGIDAPETRGKERFAGLESKAWLQDEIEGKEIEIVTFKNAKGKYGRCLGVVYLNRLNINQLMIEKELAIPSL